VKRQPILAFESKPAWREWLAEHGGSSTGVWLKLAKKGSGIASISHAEALDVALCFGWIDGQGAPFDDEHWLVRFTPRARRSKWSKRNREHVARLIESGEMTPAGLREVERAKADGRWEAAYDPQSAAAVPPDLRRALDESPGAAELFARLDSRNRYAILYRIQDAKRPETRARRIETFVAMLADGKTIHPRRGM
jgi:uncharacterized protein YdeI (YjbR/CyaY-like superfamily)